jgi:hypothetical protein
LALGRIAEIQNIFVRDFDVDAIGFPRDNRVIGAGTDDLTRSEVTPNNPGASQL